MLSVCMLVKDEDQTLQRAFDSIGPLHPQLVVGVDTSSADSTRQMAEERADIVLDIEFDGDFGKAHNRLAEHATKEWIFKLDGHEWLPNRSAWGLRSYLNNVSDDVDTIAVVIELCEEEQSERAMSPRLFRRSAGTWGGRYTRNQWPPALKQV